MIVKTDMLPKDFDGFTCWPFIFIRPSKVNNLGLLRHEMIHYNEQRWITPYWLAKYFLSRKFRLDAEVRAYKAQMECEGIALHAAATMLLKYNLNISIYQALELLEKKE